MQSLHKGVHISWPRPIDAARIEKAVGGAATCCFPASYAQASTATRSGARKGIPQLEDAAEGKQEQQDQDAPGSSAKAHMSSTCC